MTVKERPILFSAPMVRAILDGKKTQTRRIVKPQPEGAWAAPGKTASPYGVPGDRLWVRETFALVDQEAHGDIPCLLYEEEFAGPYQRGEPTPIRPTGFERFGRVPSIFMPRWASRLTLDITEVRVQQLQEIGFDDARAEGADPNFREQVDPCDAGCTGIHYGELWHYQRIWESINGKGSWDSNPWVWAITFARLP